MKTYTVLTLTQPWATLMAYGFKTIETRGWCSSFRGELLIHAAAGLAPVDGKSGYLNFCTANELVYEALEEVGLVPFTWSEEHLMALPFGKIVAKVNVEYWGAQSDYHHQPTSRYLRAAWPLTERERAFGLYGHGRYNIYTNQLQRLVEPIPARGMQRLWKWTGDIPQEGLVSVNPRTYRRGEAAVSHGPGH